MLLPQLAASHMLLPASSCCVPCLPTPCPAPPCLALQGAFKRVATEVEACARELAAILRRRLLAAPDQAAECIQMIAKLGEPTESLQVGCLACLPAGLPALPPPLYSNCCWPPLPAGCPACLPPARRRTFWSASGSGWRACWRRRG